MAVRNNIGKVKSSLGSILRKTELFDNLTQNGLGTFTSMIGSTAVDASGDKPNTEYLWGIHRWGSSKFGAGE